MLVTGVWGDLGQRLVEALARHRVRLVAHSIDAGERARNLSKTAAAEARAFRLFTGDLCGDRASGERLARSALAAFAGLDVVVNIIGTRVPSLSASPDEKEIEHAVGDLIRPASVISRAAADAARRRGERCVIAHICDMPQTSRTERALGMMLRTAIESMTRHQATQGADSGIEAYAFCRPSGTEDASRAPSPTAAHTLTDTFDTSLVPAVLNTVSGRATWLNGTALTIGQ